jgi:hypothetical protein
MIKQLIFSLLIIFSINLSHAQPPDIEKIVLEDGVSDIISIDGKKITKAYLYGVREDLIKFLINDVYIEHLLNRGIIYNFLFAENLIQVKNSNEALFDTNKILIVTDNIQTYEYILSKASPNETSQIKNAKMFQLGEINNLNIFVSSTYDDTTFFKGSNEIVRVTLQEQKSDQLKINGLPIDKVTIYGTKENIIRFLINDKFIKHKLETHGANYNFSSTDEFTEYFPAIKSDEKSTVLIVIDNKKEFDDLHQVISKKNPTAILSPRSFKLEDINNMHIIVLSSESNK